MSHFEKNHAIKFSQAPLTRELKFGSAEKKETQLKKRLIDNSKATSNSDPLFLKYKILKINDLVDFNQAIFMYKYTHKLLPASFENMFKKVGNFERSLNYQLDILKMCSLQYLPSSSLLKM